MNEQAAAAPLMLSARGVAVWRGERCLCRDLSFELHAGEALHVQGPNGAGKTSLIRVLIGLGRCDEGEVLWQSQPLRHNSASYRASLVYVGHNNGVKLGLTPRENLIAAGALTNSQTLGEVESALAQMGLSHCADMPCSTLSTGQQRRTALARLLLVRVPLWFLDEPLASLDASGVDVLTQMLKRHLASGGLAVFATHQLLQLTPFAVRALALGAVV